MNVFWRLWQDDGGAVVSAELVLIGTVLVIGVITGMSSLRDAVITELADVGAAIGLLDQSYSLHGSTSHSSATASTTYDDKRDFCDTGSVHTTSERCLVICGNSFARTINGGES